MSQRCPACRLYNPDSALRCDCGYDFVAKQQRPFYLVAETARRHGGFRPLLELQGRRNVRAGLITLGIGLVLAVAPALLFEPAADGRPRFAVGPAVLMLWGLLQAVRGHSQKAAAARVVAPDDSSESTWVDRS